MNPREDINGDGVIDEADVQAYRDLCEKATAKTTETIAEIRSLTEERVNGVRTVTVERFVPVSPQKAYWGWLSNVWQAGGGMGTPTIEEHGNRHTRAGCKRNVGAVSTLLPCSINPALTVKNSGPWTRCVVQFLTTLGTICRPGFGIYETILCGDIAEAPDYEPYPY